MSFVGRFSPFSNLAVIFDLRLVSPSKFLVSTKAKFPSEASMITTSAGNYSFSLTTMILPRPRQPHFTSGPPASKCAKLLFSVVSERWRVKSSTKFQNIETAITNNKGGKFVGLPNVIEIGLIHCKKQMTRKKMLAGFVI